MTDDYNADVADLVGKTLVAVTQNGRESIDFVADTGERWQMFHPQGCCESCDIEEVVGDYEDILGSPVLMAEVSTNSDAPKPSEYTPDSFTWTFYKFATAKGYVTVRWYGESNGYYSETASFRKVSP